MFPALTTTVLAGRVTGGFFFLSPEAMVSEMGNKAREIHQSHVLTGHIKSVVTGPVAASFCGRIEIGNECSKFYAGLAYLIAG